MCELFFLTFGNVYVMSFTKMKKINLKTGAKEIELVFGFRIENWISSFRLTNPSYHKHKT